MNIYNNFVRQFVLYEYVIRIMECCVAGSGVVLWPCAADTSTHTHTHTSTLTPVFYTLSPYNIVHSPLWTSTPLNPFPTHTFYTHHLHLPPFPYTHHPLPKHTFIHLLNTIINFSNISYTLSPLTTLFPLKHSLPFKISTFPCFPIKINNILYIKLAQCCIFIISFNNITFIQNLSLIFQAREEWV